MASNLSSDSSCVSGTNDGVQVGILGESDIPRLMEALIDVCYKWKELGIALGLPRYVIDQSKHDRHVIALNNILHEWITGNGCAATLENLKLKLSSQLIREVNVAHTLEVKLMDSPQLVDCPAKRQRILSYSETAFSGREHLMGMYSRLREVPKSIWTSVGTNEFINLVLVKRDGEIACKYDYSVRGNIDDITTNKDAARYETIFAKYIEGGLVLVEGRPGSGKTTLVHRIARDWASAKDILTNSKYVFLVPLRILDPKKSTHILSDVLEPLYWDKTELESVCDNISKLRGKGVCFIFDGLDEYQLRHNSSSVVCAIIQKRFLTYAMVVLTSRPVATAELRKNSAVTMHVEVIGFSKDQIYEYINKFPFVPNHQAQTS